MALTGNRTYVGFGFGAIQSGLFLFEAYHSGAFRRLVVAEVLPEVVSGVRSAGGKIMVNIAHHDRIEQTSLDSIEVLDPAVPDDRQHLIHAVAEAEEIGTAIPSVDYYTTEEPSSLHRILAAGLSKKVAIDGPCAVIYTAENNNLAAEILKSKIMEEISDSQQAAVDSRVRILNTVIGKMSQVVTDTAEIQQRDLATMTPDLPRAFLVESFSQILISNIQFDEPFDRGITSFIEKVNLLPFEEAKLYGHNATHALGGYLGSMMGMKYFADLEAVPGMTSFLRRAFLEESGWALIQKFCGIDPLFTRHGYQAYVDDLLERMMNPYLLDRIERVIRDPARKLGWNDRLIGTMRTALNAEIQPHRYAFGAAAALAELNEGQYSSHLLNELWQFDDYEPQQKLDVIALIEQGWGMLEIWREHNFPNLEELFG
jgi:mannitol-1-phosphate 5-dehydrogenase